MKLISKIAYKIIKFLYPFKVFGKENVPNGGAVIVCNHYSFIDCYFNMEIADRNCKILGKKEIFKSKILKAVVEDYGAIPLDRDNPSIATLMAAIKALKDEKKLILFPEGTRNKTKSSKMLKLKGGSSIFAVKSKKPIIPVMIYKKAKVFRKTYLLVGKPFYLSDFYDKKIDSETQIKMDNLIREKMEKVQLDLFEIMNNKNHKLKNKNYECI